ncbi:XdhC family protein [Williamsia maris]|uniref:Xanthine dehydrogenase accessory factor n=1 Tax=Williamsia maris TaxID=72806 RepID=A0ABT1HBE7_9NOCA|nr:XdhC/CoxI family protein [Williamsia maris]MCP2175247.1 xanthine dehydrogenase accessory factor [Williamsia maris]
MLDILDALVVESTRSPVALARIVGVTGSSPRTVGSALMVTADGDVVGSLSSGCVEAAVVAAAADVIATGEPSFERFGGSDIDPFAVGLTCGGEIEVLIERVDGPGVLVDLRSRIDARTPCALVTTVGAPTLRTVLAGSDSCTAATPWNRVDRDARALLAVGRSGMVGGSEINKGEEAAGCRLTVFVQSFATAPRMILAGANDFVRALTDTARTLGYEVTVVDARATFASVQRFPRADAVVVDWPDRYLRGEHAAGRLDARTVIAVMTHDDKFDVPTIQAALTLDRFAFVGAMGSRRTHADRLSRLVDAGVAPADLTRLHSPMGLDLDARTPEETAVSIAAQIIAVRSDASARPLSSLDGPIHR